jgi:hypothetical protein
MWKFPIYNCRLPIVNRKSKIENRKSSALSLFAVLWRTGWAGGVDLWSVKADCGGSSLGRRVAEEYGNDVANRQAVLCSPGE